MKANVRALQAREPDSPTLTRYDEVAQILTGRPTAQAAEGVIWVQDLCEALNVPPLSGFGLREEDISIVVEKARKASSMKGNPIVLTEDELTVILKGAI
jgi:alcohol dehydrogenase class IV